MRLCFKAVKILDKEYVENNVIEMFKSRNGLCERFIQRLREKYIEKGDVVTYNFFGGMYESDNTTCHLFAEFFYNPAKSKILVMGTTTDKDKAKKKIREYMKSQGYIE